MPFRAFGLALASAPITFLVHAVASILLKNRRLMPQLLAVRCSVLSAIVLSSAVVVLSFPTNHPVPSISFGLLIVTGSCHIYFHFFNMSETARRIRILMTITSGKTLSLESGADEMAVAKAIEVRLRRLTAAGHLEKVDGKYRLQPSFLLVAAMIINWYSNAIFPHGSSPIKTASEKTRKTLA